MRCVVLRCVVLRCVRKCVVDISEANSLPMQSMLLQTILNNCVHVYTRVHIYVYRHVDGWIDGAWLGRWVVGSKSGVLASHLWWCRHNLSAYPTDLWISARVDCGTSLCACLYAYLYACLYTCLHACLYTGLCTCLCICLCHVFVRMSMCMSTHVSIHLSTHMSTHMSTHVSTYVSTHISTHMYTHMYTHVYTHRVATDAIVDPCCHGHTEENTACHP